MHRELEELIFVVTNLAGRERHPPHGTFVTAWPIRRRVTELLSDSMGQIAVAKVRFTVSIQFGGFGQSRSCDLVLRLLELGLE